MMAENHSLAIICLFCISAESLESKSAGLYGSNLHPGNSIIGEVKGHPEEEVFVVLL